MQAPDWQAVEGFMHKAPYTVAQHNKALEEPLLSFADLNVYVHTAR